MCYTLRDPVSAGTFPTAVEKKPRGKAQRMEIKSRCFDACLVIDGSLSYKFNDGTRAIVSIHDEDVLRTVHIYSSDIWKKESTWISFPIPYSFLNFRLGKAKLFLKECIIFLNLKFAESIWIFYNLQIPKRIVSSKTIRWNTVFALQFTFPNAWEKYFLLLKNYNRLFQFILILKV